MIYINTNHNEEFSYSHFCRVCFISQTLSKMQIRLPLHNNESIIIYVYLFETRDQVATSLENVLFNLICNIFFIQPHDFLYSPRFFYSLLNVYDLRHFLVCPKQCSLHSSHSILYIIFLIIPFCLFFTVFLNVLLFILYVF